MSVFTGGDNAAGFAPSFIEKPKIIPNESGTLITMKCKCKAKPKPEVTWFRGTTIVKESSKISINIISVDEDIYELSLEIKVLIFFGTRHYTALLVSLHWMPYIRNILVSNTIC